jgi:hypothetical protein
MADGSTINLGVGGLSVLLTMPIRDFVTWPTMQSLMETQALMLDHGIPFEMRATVGGVAVQVGRSLGMHEALKTAHNRFFMIDADMHWKAPDFVRLVALSSKMECVGAVYCNREDPPQFFINPEPGDIVANEWGCLPFRGMGLGFTIVHREVIERLAVDAPKLKFPGKPDSIAHIFPDGVDDDQYQGEDMKFFASIRAKGYGVWVDPNIVLGHCGTKVYSASILDHVQKVTEAA